MTAKPVPDAHLYMPETRFPDTPKVDMQNLNHLHGPGYPPILSRHFAARDTTAVLSEFPIGRNVHQRQGLLSPDLLIAFDVEPATIIADNGYAIDYHGKAPDFVLEIAFPGAAHRDEVHKRQGYEAYGVSEYWRYDYTDSHIYSVNLAGDRLINGQYQPIPITEVSNARHWGYSAALGLYVCWEYGHLRWYNPATGCYLPTHDQIIDARIAAEAVQAAAKALQNAKTRLAAIDAQLVAPESVRLAVKDHIRQRPGV